MSCKRIEMESTQGYKRICAIALSVIAFSVVTLWADVKFSVLPPRNVIEGNKFNVTAKHRNELRMYQSEEQEVISW